MDGIKLVLTKTIQLFSAEISFGQFKFTLLQIWVALWAISIIAFFIRKVFLDD